MLECRNMHYPGNDPENGYARRCKLEKGHDGPCSDEHEIECPHCGKMEMANHESLPECLTCWGMPKVCRECTLENPVCMRCELPHEETGEELHPACKTCQIEDPDCAYCEEVWGSNVNGIYM